MIKAAGQGATLEHLGNRTAAAIDDSIALGKEGAGIVSVISRGLAFNPKAFMCWEPGGVDGNGGIPDR